MRETSIAFAIVQTCRL